MRLRRLPGQRLILVVRAASAMLLLAGAPASAGLFIGEAGPADEREASSGFIPGDAGYWIGGAGGFLYDCWSDDNPRTAEWGLYCRAYQSGAPLGHPVPITQSVGYTVFFPAGCFGPDGDVRLLWSGNGQLWFSRSDDSGSTWSDPLRIDHGPGSVVMTAEPRIACGAAEVYVAWEDSREGAKHVYFNRSLDGGESWEASDARIDAADGEVEGYRYGPILAADSSGEVYPAWVKGGHLYARVSNDFGESWADEAQLDVLGVPDPASARPSIAADESGHVYVAWRSVFGQMYLNRSSDAGATWLDSEQRISDHQAVIAVDGTVATDGKGHVYGLWYYQAQGSFVFDVRFNVSSDYGETWGECAGINRHGGADERAVRRRASNPRRPQAVRRCPRGRRRSVGRGTRRQGIEPRNRRRPECRRCSPKRKATRPEARMQAFGWLCAVGKTPRMRGTSVRENREVR